MSNQSTEIYINAELVKNLLIQQCPQFANLPISEVDIQGHDNRTFRMGLNMLIRLPSAERYAAKVDVEHHWLPILAKHLSIQIPTPIYKGLSTKTYPWNWSIYRWIEGQSLNQIKNFDNKNQLANDLADFLIELQKTPPFKTAPRPGPHNFFRGASPKIYEQEALSEIQKLRPTLQKYALEIWELATTSPQKQNDVWLHGDLAVGNILINPKTKRLCGIIDFGGMAVGDPACDLTMFWTFFEHSSAEIFKQKLNLDQFTWNRAAGWALWKALITNQINITEKIINHYNTNNK